MIKSNGNQFESKFLISSSCIEGRYMYIKHQECFEVIAEVVLLMYIYHQEIKIIAMQLEWHIIYSR